jgi:hypothetical protein
MTFAKTLFWVVIVTTTRRELREVKLKCLTHQIFIHTKIIMVFFKPYLFHAKEVNTSLILKS